MNYIIVFMGIAVIISVFFLRRTLRRNKKKRYRYSSRKLAAQLSTTKRKLGVLTDKDVKASLGTYLPSTILCPYSESVEEMLRRID